MDQPRTLLTATGAVWLFGHTVIADANLMEID